MYVCVCMKKSTLHGHVVCGVSVLEHGLCLCMCDCFRVCCCGSLSMSLFPFSIPRSPPPGLWQVHCAFNSNNGCTFTLLVMIFFFLQLLDGVFGSISVPPFIAVSHSVADFGLCLASGHLPHTAWKRADKAVLLSLHVVISKFSDRDTAKSE